MEDLVKYRDQGEGVLIDMQNKLREQLEQVIISKEELKN